MKVIVIKNNLRYRIPGVKKGRAFIPKIGDMIGLPQEVAEKELESKNVRKLMKEEAEVLKKKMAAKKAKKAKAAKAKKGE